MGYQSIILKKIKIMNYYKWNKLYRDTTIKEIKENIVSPISE